MKKKTLTLDDLREKVSQASKELERMQHAARERIIEIGLFDYCLEFAAELGSENGELPEYKDDETHTFKRKWYFDTEGRAGHWRFIFGADMPNEMVRNLGMKAPGGGIMRVNFLEMSVRSVNGSQTREISEVKAFIEDPLITEMFMNILEPLQEKRELDEIKGRLERFQTLMVNYQLKK